MQPARNPLLRAVSRGLAGRWASAADPAACAAAAAAAPLSTSALASAPPPLSVVGGGGAPSSSSSPSPRPTPILLKSAPLVAPARPLSPLVAAAPYATTAGGVPKFALPALPYSPSALEPVISGAIMELHHGKHHAAYVANLNVGLEAYADAEAKGDLAKMLALQPAIHFNAGGHINHDIFWTNLAAEKDCRPPEGALKAALEARWGALDKFVGEFNAATAAVQGSGWGWLGYDVGTGGLAIATAANQDPIAKASGGRLVPLLGIDVWEHAYYLQYKNARPDYLKAIWRVVNWANVEERYAKAKAAAGK